MKNNKNFKLILIVIAIALLLVVGTSYALWILTFKQNGDNVLTTDCFRISFSEVSGTDINLTNTYPMTDEEGSQTSPYQFTIKNVCSYIADYDITLEAINTSTLSADYLRSKLNDNNPITLGSIANNENLVLQNASYSKTLGSGSLLENEEVSYDLRLWVDNDSTKEQSANKEFKGKVVVVASVNKGNHMITLNTNGGSIANSRLFANVGKSIGNIPTPTNDEGEFLGWYSDSELTNAVTSDTIVTEELTNLYAKWHANYAMFDTGSTVNSKWKTLAKGSSAYSYTVDTLITSIQRSEILNNTENIISTTDS
ncbi:MAG: InlB B-repeat-containing protein, partial [Bacilli bacterium]|nr:InlB B-repeat-containing protein [Bacilli bacterium]